jgi:hypothetical protein
MLNPPAVAGLVSLAWPALLWCAALLQAFGARGVWLGLIEPLDRFHPAASLVLFLLLPLGAVVWNTVHVLRLSLEKSGRSWTARATVSKEPLNLALLAAGAANCCLLALYLLTENIHLVDSHTGRVLL